MPILFVHGVSIRDDGFWARLELLLRRYLAPIISPDPENVTISCCYWGDLGAKFCWDGASTPVSPLRAIRSQALVSATQAKQKLWRSKERLGRLSLSSRNLIVRAGISSRALANKRNSARQEQLIRLKDLTKDKLSNLCASIISHHGEEATANERMLAMMAADEVAHEPETFAQLEKCKKPEDEIALMQKLVRARYEKLRGDVVIGMKVKLPNLSQKLRLNFQEFFSRTAHGAGFAMTRAAAEVRDPINGIVTLFIGDVFTYMHGRGDAHHPGAIPLRVLETLAVLKKNQMERGGEPLIVLSHSMGGQIIYDVVTHFIPRMPQFRDLRIDFWCATASQVGLFEELKLFLESSSQYGSDNKNAVPFPDRRNLGAWWNVWDYNDFVSWSAKGIIDGIDDEGYNSGLFLVNAHCGYIELPSFFRKFARKMEKAKAADWMRS